MNPSNHTPAPWHPHRSESGFVVVYSDGENRSHVARLFDSTLGEEHGSIEANARLIASAPDLLRALQRLVLEVESICAHEAGAMRDVLIERLHKDWDGKILDSRLAISKAKGQE